MHAKVAQVVHGKRDLHAYGLPRRGDVFAELLDAFLGDLGAGEQMRQLAPLPRRFSGWHGHGSRSFGDHLDAQIHLQPCETHFFLANLQALSVLLDVVGLLGIGINANLIAEFAA